MLEKSGFNFQLHCHPTLQQWETATSEDKRLHTTHQPFLEAHVTEFGMCRIVLPSLRKRGGKERVCVKESKGERAQGDRGELLTVLCVCSRVAREQQMASLRVSLPWSVTLPLVVPLMLLSTKSTANR